jgi:hypothetical protein
MEDNGVLERGGTGVARMFALRFDQLTLIDHYG